MPTRAAIMKWCFGCLCGAFVLAFVAVACFGGTAIMVYALVVLSRTPRSNAAGIVVLSVFLHIWVCFSAQICGHFFTCSDLGDCMAPVLRAALPCLRGAGRLLCLPCWCVRAVRSQLRRPGTNRAATGGSILPRSATENHVMEVLPREAPARSGTRVVAIDDIPAYVQRDAKRLDGPSESQCVVCLGEVESGEMVKRLPVYLHMFHQTCIDPWLLSGKSTCPVCWCDVFAPLPPEIV